MSHSTSLSLARGWYALIGAGALLLTGGEISGDFTPGAVVDVPNLAAGLAVGLLALAAAAWVLAPSPLKAWVAWLGIVAGLAPFGWTMWIAAATSKPDAILLAGVPALVALAAAIRLARARMAAVPA